MSRADSLGLFWQDIKEEKLKKEKKKREPPPRTWEDPSYLPYLDEALAFDIGVLTDDELASCAFNNGSLAFDVECYPNYFEVGFKSIELSKVLYFEFGTAPGIPGLLDYKKLEWIIQNCQLIGFNSRNYDLPMLSLAMAGLNTAELKDASDRIIQEGWRPNEVLRAFKVPALKCNHIDLIEVAPLRASLKIYAGRMHSKRMQDLPFNVDTELTYEQCVVTRWYNLNDLQNTLDLKNHLQQQLDLRVLLSSEFKTDLRSKSDAQIAEAVISDAVAELNGSRARPPYIEPGTGYKYNIPDYLDYQTDLMKWVLQRVEDSVFTVGLNGSCGMPKELQDMQIRIGNSVYRMGIGGLHSCEERVAHHSDKHFKIIDQDVTSYYPMIILNQELYPEHMGRNFLRVYRQIVDRRVEAKKADDKSTSDTLKIVINGTFGKLANMFSDMYSPNLGIQVTVTGQLTLLLLIEKLELYGIPVVSANTDGIVIKCPRHKEHIMQSLVREWEYKTKFQMESTEYVALYSRDVNSYIAVKPDRTLKGKGAYANPWNDKKLHAFELHKNPTNTICIKAVGDYLCNGTPIDHTIGACRDIRQFVSVRNVKGGAVKDGEYLGKSIRWYYAQGEEGEIVYAMSGNKVPRSDGAKPLMTLPDKFPEDVDFEWYFRESNKILEEIGLRALQSP